RPHRETGDPTGHDPGASGTPEARLKIRMSGFQPLAEPLTSGWLEDTVDSFFWRLRHECSGFQLNDDLAFWMDTGPVLPTSGAAISMSEGISCGYSEQSGSATMVSPEPTK